MIPVNDLTTQAKHLQLRAGDAAREWARTPEWIAALATAVMAGAALVPSHRLLAAAAAAAAVWWLHGQRPPPLLTTLPAPAPAPKQPTIAIGEPAPSSAAPWA